MKLTPWDSITGSSIAVGNVCHVRQPRLSEVRRLGYDKFFGYVSVIMFDPSELDGQMPMLIPDLSTFYILITYPMLRETFSRHSLFLLKKRLSLMIKACVSRSIGISKWSAKSTTEISEIYKV